MTNPSDIWDSNQETLDRGEMRQLQLERLQAGLFRVYRNVAFYRKQFNERGIAPEDVQSLDDVQNLPFTTRADLREGYPYDMLAVPLSEVVRLHSSSWSTGHPIVCAFTRNDMTHWRECCARLLAAAGLTRDDVALILFSPRKLDSGLAFHAGAERIGASVIPTTPDDIEQQLGIMQDFRTTIIAGTVSDGARLTAAVQERGLSLQRLSLRIGLFGAEPCSEVERDAIAAGLGINTLDYYDLSEAGGLGIAGECTLRTGLHLAEDHYLAEIIEPETGTLLPEGQVGELVLTTLTKEAAPLIRFRTGDITSLHTEPCACGRTLGRISRIACRTDDLLFAQGYSFYPSRIKEILESIEGAAPHFLLTLARNAGVDEVEVKVEVAQSMFSDSIGNLLALEQRILDAIRKATGVRAHIRLVEPQLFSKQMAGKNLRVIDTREISKG